jgi:hypothetical protein
MTPPSTERRFVKGAQLARMQRLTVFSKEVEGREADPQVLGNSALIKGARRSGKFDFSVQRLVRNAQERAIGHAQPEALRRNRS